MEKKSIKKNYLYNLIYQVFLLLTPLVTTPYISRVLGADGIGSVSYAESIVSYFVLFGTLGITTYGQREISYVQDSIEKRSTVFWNTKCLEFITSAVALVLYLLFSAFQRDSIIFLILSLNLVAVFFDVTWFFQGVEEFGKIVFRNLILRILNILYIFIFVKTSKDIYAYAFGLAFFTVAGNLSLWLYLSKYIKKVKIRSISPFNNIRTVISLFIPTIAVQIYTVLDKTMIGVIASNYFENGYYEQASKMCKMVLVIVTSLGAVVVPRVGYYFTNNKMEEVKRLIYRSYRFVLFLGVPLALGLSGIASSFVPWFLGPGYDKVEILLPILSVLIIAIGISGVTGMQYLVPTKRQNLLTRTVLIGAVVNLLLNMFLIPRFASVGAAVASIIAEITVSCTQIYFVRNEISAKIIIKQGIKYYFSGIFMLGVILYLKQFLIPNIVGTFVLICTGVIAYFGILIVLKDDFLIDNIRGLCKKIKKR